MEPTDPMAFETRPEILREIALTCIAWAHLEARLSGLLFAVTDIGAEAAHAVMSATESNRTRREIAMSCALQGDITDDDKSAVKAILDKIARLAGPRNDLIHTAWLVDDADKERLIAPVELSAPTTQRRRLTPKSARKLRTDIEATAHDLHLLSLRLLGLKERPSP